MNKGNASKATSNGTAGQIVEMRMASGAARFAMFDKERRLLTLDLRRYALYNEITALAQAFNGCCCLTRIGILESCCARNDPQSSVFAGFLKGRY